MKKKKQSPDFFSSAGMKKYVRKSRQTIVPNYQNPQPEIIRDGWRKQTKWHHHYQELKDFKKHYGHCMVPHNWEQNPLLANWVRYQRHRAALLTKEKYQLLNELGFEWDQQESRWMNNYEKLRRYHELFGNCDLSDPSPEYKPLAAWAALQRRFKKWNSTNLKPEHIYLLEQISFDWTYRKNKKKLPEK